MVLSLARRSLPQRRLYTTYRSPYAPRYATRPNFHGVTATDATQIGVAATGFGVATGIFLLYFFGEVPRVRHDILVKVPVFGPYWERKIPPEDNPF